ncbi:alpha/beta fold hydrolase [Zobellia alginiliquefaciens]|uniref:alpha/beta fold hydrolase n=1 Tax=Zobellia alginiliquefaciens TaxID=3032586 RepID=UPI0023E24170|nr:alpha/beta hydrolase [Zobellia alginiliquefaciens]
MKKLILFILSIVVMQGLLAQEDNFAEVNDIKLYYEIKGEGDAILLLHGHTMTHDMWSPWVDELSENNMVITVDTRGHGQSTTTADSFTFKAAAVDFYGLLDKLKVDKFSAMGFSGGAMALLHMATMDTTRIQSLILLGSTPHLPKETREWLASKSYETVASDRPDWITYMKAVQPGGEDQIRLLLKYYNQMADSYTDMNFTAPYLSTINCPTLIINGDQDPIIPVDIAVGLYNAIPESSLWIVPNLGHAVPQKETILGELFTETIVDFLVKN